MASTIKVDQIEGSTGSTVTVPAGQTLTVSGTLGATSGVNLTALNATNLGSGTVATARLGTGTADATTFLRGDQTYAAAGGGGKMGQMISTQLDVEQSTTSTSFVAITGVTGSITPAATSSKVWIQGTLLWGRSTNNTMWMQMFRGSTLINEQTFSTGIDTDSFYGSGTNSGYYVLRQAPFSFLDSPNTSSAETYTIKWRVDGNTIWLNRIGADTNQAGTSQFNLIEILA